MPTRLPKKVPPVLCHACIVVHAVCALPVAHPHCNVNMQWICGYAFGDRCKWSHTSPYVSQVLGHGRSPSSPHACTSGTSCGSRSRHPHSMGNGRSRPVGASSTPFLPLSVCVSHQHVYSASHAVSSPQATPPHIYIYAGPLVGHPCQAGLQVDDKVIQPDQARLCVCR